MPSDQTEFTARSGFNEELVPQRSITMSSGREKIEYVSESGDTRSGIERRRFSYDAHIPERRSGKDRRGGGATVVMPFEGFKEIGLACG